MDKDQISLIEDQFSTVKAKYPGINLIQFDGNLLIRGILDFRAKYGEETISGVFNIEINFSEDYPESPPAVKEIGGCIPSDFHKHQDGTLCLGAPIIIKIQLSRNPTLIAFIEQNIIPYLYSFRYWEKHGSMPYGDYAHGFEGIIQSYKDLFNTSSDWVVLRFLKMLGMGNYRGHLPCPCDSGEKIRNCHGHLLQEVALGINKEFFLYHFSRYLYLLHESGIKIPIGIYKSARKVFKETEKLDKTQKNRL